MEGEDVLIWSWDFHVDWFPNAGLSPLAPERAVLQGYLWCCCLARVIRSGRYSGEKFSSGPAERCFPLAARVLRSGRYSWEKFSSGLAERSLPLLHAQVMD